jgi:hypothetical protein
MTNLKLNISFILCLGQKNEPRENEKSWKVTKYFRMRILVRNGLMGIRKSNSIARRTLPKNYSTMGNTSCDHG